MDLMATMCRMLLFPAGNIAHSSRFPLWAVKESISIFLDSVGEADHLPRVLQRRWPSELSLGIRFRPIHPNKQSPLSSDFTLLTVGFYVASRSYTTRGY